jgi:3-deoxy-D-manno-octulosonic-acid transferase
MAGEEEQVLEAFRRLGTDRALLLLAPRHPERFDDVARLIEGRGFALLRRSELDSLGDGAASSSVDVVLLDTLGELAGLYAMASAAFVGGTLVPTGGHNPLEPARYGTPVVVGPSMENFREMAQHFDRAQAWHRVADAAELAECFDRLLSQPEQAGAVGARGRQLIEDNRGAADRTRDLLSSLGFEQFANRSPATEPEPAPAESQQ